MLTRNRERLVLNGQCRVALWVGGKMPRPFSNARELGTVPPADPATVAPRRGCLSRYRNYRNVVSKPSTLNPDGLEGDQILTVSITLCDTYDEGWDSPIYKSLRPPQPENPKMTVFSRQRRKEGNPHYFEGIMDNTIVVGVRSR